MLQINLLLALILAPLFGFLINGLTFKNKNYKLAGGFASFMVFISFVCSVCFFFLLLGMPEGSRVIKVTLFEWLSVGSLSVPFSFIIDPISSIMILIITGVGFLIHLFSIGYMSHDERPAKYFAYLNFFIFNMLLLVLGENLLLMFFGWEGVGLCSYLLIGFWFSDKAKAAAGMKAFIVNRIGDAAFLIGIFLIFQNLGTLSFAGINELAPDGPQTWSNPLVWACLFLFIGATGKSAQIPLFVWLPDAMAGPTPVSALIHAATMVTAGVYMICRLSFLYITAPQVLMIVAIIGVLTVVMAALIGLTQWDIKKVLAYSTVSQLGYMFLACGVGAFGAAFFHLMTHAFFKALMFLGSGSVIHAMNEEQDMRKMGGLKKYMPITHFTFLMGWLAIIGTPFFSGFFSKDEILWMSLHSPNGSPILWIMGVIGAVLTAFYMTRLMCLTFWGEKRYGDDVHPHEASISMTIPLISLAILSVFGGFIGIPHVISSILPGHPPNLLEHWLEGSIAKIPGLAAPNITHEWLAMGASVSLAAISCYVAYTFYIKSKGSSEKFVAKVKPAYNLVNNKFWIDEIYSNRIVSPLMSVSKNLWYHIDVEFIDKITHWVSDFCSECSKALKNFQNGNLQQYALFILIGTVAVVLYAFLGV